MKTLILSFIFLFAINLSAQNLTFDWAAPGTNNFIGNDPVICGNQQTVRLRVGWNNDPNCPYPGWGANRYRFTIRLFKNNALISTRIYPASNCFINDFYDNYVLTEGTYRAEIQLEVRRAFWRWRIQATGNAGVLIVTREASVPGLKINGQVPDPNIPIEVCPGNIQIDASDTKCEDKYWIGVWEFDFVNWNRPQRYEWGKWFNGQAPANLNLQQLAAQHSFGSDFLGNDNTREGEILFGGLLTNGTPRYYRVEVCTGTPQWQCKTGVIKVKCSCP